MYRIFFIFLSKTSHVTHVRRRMYVITMNIIINKTIKNQKFVNHVDTSVRIRVYRVIFWPWSGDYLRYGNVGCDRFRFFSFVVWNRLDSASATFLSRFSFFFWWGGGSLWVILPILYVLGRSSENGCFFYQYRFQFFMYNSVINNLTRHRQLRTKIVHTMVHSIVLLAFSRCIRKSTIFVLFGTLDRVPKMVTRRCMIHYNIDLYENPPRNQLVTINNFSIRLGE